MVAKLWVLVAALVIAAPLVAAEELGTSGVVEKANVGRVAGNTDTGGDTGGVKERYIVEKERFKNAVDALRNWMTFGFVLNEDTFDEAKELGTAAVDFAIASLESIKEKIEASNPSMKDEVVVEIDGHIADLLSAKEGIEAAASVVELRDALKAAREEWIEAKVSLQKSLILRVLDRVEAIINRGERIESFVEDKISELADEGKDATLLENWLEKFRSDREKAYEKVEEAREKVMGVENPAQGFKAMSEAKIALRAAVEHTKKCMNDLKELMRLINVYGSEE